ncbi:serpin H1 isoform X2 [Pararge aegeria]|nr:serpin H1 isoform X2 [Pararge aegeria]
MQLPWNRNIMRIGFRDIHRTLKTYFVPEEGFLAGLALNNENVTFTESYKKILRFYGFDLEGDQLATSKPNNTAEAPQVTTDSLNHSTSTTSTSSISSSTPTTMITIAEKITSREDPLTSQSTKATIEETSPKPQADTQDTENIREENSDTPITSTVASSTNSIETTTNNGANTQTQTIAVSSSAVTEPFTTTTETSKTDVSTTQMMTQESTETTMTSGSTITDEVTSTFTTSTTETLTSTDSSTMTTNIQTVGTSSVTETQQSEQMSSNTESTTESISTMPTTSTLETLERRKKSVLDFLYTSPPYDDDYLVYRSYDIGTDLPNDNSYEDDKNFMANGLRNIQVAYMHYDSVMEYAYLPHLEASALRLPLDSERYYLLVILPARRGSGELDRLLARMARESDLSDVYAALHPRRVRAVVPSFIVKGHVTLTTDLQKIGIRDVFEPRQHDFTPMTQQAGVYVRSIEQAVSVAIRKYQPDIKNRYISNRGPVLFSATYPFLYFVMDTNIHVALMAGKMVDPLNTRIL